MIDMRNLRLTLTLICVMVMSIAQAATPKYVFYFIGDGMGVGQVQALRTYYKTVGEPADDAVHFYDFPFASIITTYSANSDVTDSAAAGTALACGSKTHNGMIGMDADTVALTSVAKQMKAKGRGVALISSVCLDDATPAAFYATSPNRNYYYSIAQQGAESGFDFLAGAYFRDPYGVKAKSAGNVFAEYEAAGYEIVRGREGYDNALSARAERILWLDADTVSENRIGYVVDGDNGDMTLPQLVESGIDFLYKKYPKGFFMMAEGGAIDHMGHANDPAGVLGELRAFDAAVQEAYEFYLKHPNETLIIITADHETGGLSMGANGVYAVDMNVVEPVEISKGEFAVLMRNLFETNGRRTTWEHVETLMSQHLGLCSEVKLTAGEEGRLKVLFQEVLENRSKDVETLYHNFDELTNEIYKVYSDKCHFGWTTSGHSGNPVPLFVIGAGAEYFEGTGWLDNTDIPRLIGKATRVTK